MASLVLNLASSADTARLGCWENRKNLRITDSRAQYFACKAGFFGGGGGGERLPVIPKAATVAGSVSMIGFGLRIAVDCEAKIRIDVNV